MCILRTPASLGMIQWITTPEISIMEWQVTLHHIRPKVRMTWPLLAARSATFQGFFPSQNIPLHGASSQNKSLHFNPEGRHNLGAAYKGLTSQKKTDYCLKTMQNHRILCIRIGIGQDKILMFTNGLVTGYLFSQTGFLPLFWLLFPLQFIMPIFL